VRRGEESREGEGVRMWGDRGVFKGGEEITETIEPVESVKIVEAVEAE